MKLGFFAFLPFSNSLPLFLIIAFVNGSQELLSSQNNQQCVYEHFSSLLEFQSNLSLWNPQNKDCCTWEGVRCERASGHVTHLYLSGLNFAGKINFEGLCRIRSLQVLDLTHSFIRSIIPSAIGGLTSLIHLNLHGSGFYGRLPLEMSRLSKLVSLDLSFNGYFDAYSDFVPLKSERIGTLIENMSNLRELYLDRVDMSAESSEWSQVISSSLPNLHELSMYNCSLSGSIHLPWLVNLTTLKYLDLASNYLNGVIPFSLFTLQSLQSLVLWGNQLGGQLSEFHNSSSSLLESIILGDNKLQGMIPRSIFQLKKLKFLGLGYNNFSGILDPYIFQNLTNLIYLNLSNNTLQGPHPILPPSIITFKISSNRFSGEIPMSICTASYLSTFVISGNSFIGHIPQCLGNMNNSLTQVDLDCSLEKLDLSENHLEGKLPEFLAKCKNLTIINIANNKIQDKFPSWVHGLAYLSLFILKSNYFYGPIQSPTACHNYSMLQIFDLSFNNFNGSLPPNMFCGWKKMMGEDASTPEYLRAIVENDTCYFEQVTVSVKGSHKNLERISTAQAIVDLSKNQFQGQIPESIGTLKSLWILNMSNNGFTGHIPVSLRNLTALESLDLSQNNLTGKIPPQLLELTFLSVLDLSNNQLTGSIPHDKQFSTFTNESFQGNPGLCGPPLSKLCEETNAAQSSDSNEEQDLLTATDFDWEIVGIGFGIGYGVGVGLFCWTLVLWTKGRRAYYIFVDRMLSIIWPSAV